MRKLLIILTVMLLCLQVLSAGAALGAVVYSDNITITSFDTSETDIYQNYEFELRLYCKNTFDQEMKDVYLEVDPDCAFLGSAADSVKVYDSIQNKGAIYESLPIDLIYKGKGNDFSFKLEYTVGDNDYIEMKHITIENAHPSSDSTPGTVDTKEYAPQLNITGGIGVKDASAGDKLNLAYPIKNSSKYSAKNVVVSLEMADASKAPYVLDNLDLKQNVGLINGGATKDVSFNLGIPDTAPEGVYGIKVNYQFQNTFNDSFNTSETVYIKIHNEKPWLAVDNISLTPDESSQNGIMDLKIAVKNLGSMPAEDVKVTLKGLKSGGFTTYNTTDLKYIDKIDGNAADSVTYALNVPSSGSGAANDLSVKLDYTDETGAVYTDEDQIFLPLDGNGGGPDLSFDGMQSPQGAVSPNTDFTVGFDLKNNGAGTAKNIKVSLAADKAIATKSLSVISADSLGKNASKRVDFKLFATDDAVTMNYPIALNLEYEDVYGTKYTASQYVGVFVDNGAGKSVPRIIVSNYSLEPTEVKAGEDFKLKVSFMNTSRTSAISNIKASFTSDDGVFTPSNSSNTFFIEDIGMKESVEKELTLHAKPDAEAKSYILTVNFDYEDEKGTPYTSKETISIPLTQNPRLVTGDLSLPPQAFTGQPVQIYVDFYNMGKSILYNLIVEAKGDFQGQNLSYYVGNFEPGRSDSFDTTITPSAAGTLKGNVVFSFEDANGKKSEISKDFSVTVADMQQAAVGPQMPGKGIVIGPDGKPVVQGQTGPRRILLIGGIGVFVVIAALVTFIVLRKRSIKRKEMSLDE